MKKKLFLKSIFILLMFLFSFVCKAAEDNVGRILLVTSEKIFLKQSNSKDAANIIELQFGDQVEALEAPVGSMLFVEAKNSIKGWVDLNDTSYVPQNWIQFNKVQEVVFFIPKDENLQFLENTDIIGGGITGKKYTENKLFNKNYFIILHHYFYAINQELEESVNKKYNSQKIIYKDKIQYYLTGIDKDSGNSSTIYKIIINGKQNDCYEMVIILKGDLTKIRIDTAKKILFSFKIK
jgi:hypothetical protein